MLIISTLPIQQVERAKENLKVHYGHKRLFIPQSRRPVRAHIRSLNLTKLITGLYQFQLGLQQKYRLITFYCELN